MNDAGKLLLYDRAGCAQADVLRELGMHPRDLFHWRVPEGITLATAQTSAALEPADVAALRVYVDQTTQALYDQETTWATTAAGYARARFGLDLADAIDAGVGVDTGGAFNFPYLSGKFRNFPRLTVPFAGFDGVIRGLQGRDLSGQCSARWLSLTNPEVGKWAKFGVFRGGGEYGTYIVTEGPGDALTAAAVGYDAVAVRGASISANPDMVADLADGMRGSHVIIAGDRDQAGDGFTARLAEGLRGHGIHAHALSLPETGDDLTAWRERDPDTFADALHAAVQSATPVAPPREVRDAERGAALDTATGTDTVSRDDGDQAAKLLADLTDRYGDTDAMRAHALVAFSDGRIKHSEGLGFYVWTGKYWEPSATKTRQEIHRMGAALALAGKTTEAKGFLNTSRIEALMVELKAVPAVHVDASDFDSRHDLLSVRNGTIDLRTGQLRAHDMRDMITQIVNVDYRPDATAPRWESFLREVFPKSPEMPAYMQRLIGYGVTGSTAEQCFAVLWGKGANGKSVMMDTITAVFDSVSKATPFATFEEKPNGGIPNDLASLRGARLVRASEGDQGKPMAEGVIKQATGGNPLTARFLRKEFFTFQPSFLLLMDTNHKPKFRGQDEGIWRRVKMIPFERWFAPHERDHKLPVKLLEETPGILAWAVRGAVEWYANGLQDPPSIAEATKEYKETSDALAGFYPGVLVPGTDADKVLGSDAFNAYLDWCEAENLPQKERWTRRGFYSAMEERGVYRKKTTRGIALFGVRVATTPGDGEPEEPPAQRVSATDIFGQNR
ncbi:phage/plasmid primase, P4 family [Nocardiopsis alba]|uniref:phage/plasmid primase, P4 family n=1 Tax=Nocardiopsis alba TaxID=53437 RepID=UPI00381CE1B3